MENPIEKRRMAKFAGACHPIGRQRKVQVQQFVRIQEGEARRVDAPTEADYENEPG
jgi:hypothetical protein